MELLKSITWNRRKEFFIIPWCDARRHYMTDIGIEWPFSAWILLAFSPTVPLSFHCVKTKLVSKRNIQEVSTKYIWLIDIPLSHGCVCVLLPVSCCVSSSFPQYQYGCIVPACSWHFLLTRIWHTYNCDDTMSMIWLYEPAKMHLFGLYAF